mmetsp:Transcript_29837/g.70919  ORF Transcript_29837/g.70919 Transcript_29837/m.70919 type:complete len:203 (-) Transcript_29837:148-756(-)
MGPPLSRGMSSSACQNASSGRSCRLGSTFPPLACSRSQVPLSNRVSPSRSASSIGVSERCANGFCAVARSTKLRSMPASSAALLSPAAVATRSTALAIASLALPLVMASNSLLRSVRDDTNSFSSTFPLPSSSSTTMSAAQRLMSHEVPPARRCCCSELAVNGPERMAALYVSAMGSGATRRDLEAPIPTLTARAATNRAPR